jgi:SpoVK/Ycf46/Vps4 family AAA+-type ATPase
VLNEASKLKHKKQLKKCLGLDFQGTIFNISKYNYSIRVKVALLADLVLSNLSVKLDMITDLLVIIDKSVNRGFAVFATTHIPYILTLLRTGRFDETISIPLIPGLYGRWANIVQIFNI